MLPFVPLCHPHIRDMTEQVDLGSLFGPEPPRHGL
jgi:hypothetical protein